MKITGRKTRLFLFGCLLASSLLLKLCIGYNFYVNGTFIGVVRTPSEAGLLLEILTADFTDFSVSSAIYPRFASAAAVSSASEIMENAQRAFDIETEILAETVSLPFSSETVPDAALYVGETSVLQAGVPGVRTIVREVRRQGDSCMTEKILSDTVTTQPVPEKRAVGTKPRPRGLGSGTFSLPLASFSVSSPFGARGAARHMGVDLAAAHGEAVFAADTGIVTFSGPCEGYGNLLILDHQNGYTTYYAHCSVLYAAAGAETTGGEVIAAVGSTGKSTGPHLHFEIRKDGAPVDPASLLPEMQ